MSKQPTALICGVTGQDGAYLAKLLLDRGYRVIGTSRDAAVASLERLRRLGVHHQVEMMSMAMNDFRSVLQVLVSAEPDEVYNLAGQTSVGLSFSQPVETTESIGIGTLNLLEAIRFLGKPIRMYNAGSGECFGDTRAQPANEDTPFRPRSPYAVAKSTAHWMVANYREAYGLYACTGILFNHESILRPERFVTTKIVKAAARIANGSGERLSLGNIDVSRDWGWAEEFVVAIWAMLQLPAPEDLIIATGHTHRLEDFVIGAFEEFDLDWKAHVDVNPLLKRPLDISISVADPSRASERLGWQGTVTMPQVVKRLAAEERRVMASNAARRTSDS